MKDIQHNENEDEYDDIRNSLTDEEIDHLDLESELGRNLKNLYEEKTEKHAIWRGNVTEAFK